MSVDDDQQTRRNQYDNMIWEHPRPWCWACGAGPEFAHKPTWWHGPWVIHRHHIVRQPRRKDRRAVILLCPLCHDLAHGARFPAVDKPPLELAHQLMLKYQHDRFFFDAAFLAGSSTCKLPELAEPPGIYTVDYCSRRPVR